MRIAFAILAAAAALAATPAAAQFRAPEHKAEWPGMVSGSDGIEGLDPGPETTGNGYEADNTASSMPIDWRDAIEAARASEFLKTALGEDLHRTFVAIKHAEYLRVARTVSELDYHLYLHEV